MKEKGKGRGGASKQGLYIEKVSCQEENESRGDVKGKIKGIENGGGKGLTKIILVNDWNESFFSLSQ